MEDLGEAGGQRGEAEADPVGGAEVGDDALLPQPGGQLAEAGVLQRQVRAAAPGLGRGGQLDAQRRQPGLRQLLGAGLVIVLFLAFGYLGIRTSLGAPDTFGSLLAAGITSWICIQAFINIGVNLGALPTKGLTLPLMSYGGSAIVMNVVALAIVLRIDIENRQLMRGGRA